MRHTHRQYCAVFRHFLAPSKASQRLGLEVRKPQKGNRRGKFTRVSGKEERYRVTAYLDRPTREALHMAEFHCRMTATGMLEQATVEYLERRGFKVR